MKFENLKLFSIKIFLISCVPIFLIYRFCNHKLSFILLVLITLTSIISFFNDKFASLIKEKSSQLAHKIGNAISYSILTIIFIFVLIPTKILMLLVKRDRLKIHHKNDATYWSEYTDKKQDYELQY